MKSNCEQQGYALYAQEVREYAALVAATLGCELDGLEDEERIRACHALLQQHPYAYPLALELSLQLPAAMAITWLRKLCAAFYAREDVQDEIDAFLVWRMSPMQGLMTALRHAERRGWFLQGVQGYLDEKHPLLARYVRRRRQWDMRDKPSLAARLDTLLQKVCRWLWPVGRETSPKYSGFISFYLRHDTAQKPGHAPARLLTWILMRFLSCRVGAGDAAFRREWMDLPFVEIPGPKRMHGHEPRLDVVTVIWGEAYVRSFFSFSAPSLLAEGNLPAAAAKSNLRLVFYTTREDMARLRAHPLLTRLGEYATLRFVFIERILKDTAAELLGMRFADKYLAMTAAHNHCLRIAALEDRYVFCNFPDILWQKDYITRLLDMAAQGKKQIFAYSGPYTCMESVREELENHMEQDAIALDNSALRALCHKHRHPFAQLFYEGAPLRYFGALMRLYDVGGEGFIAHMACHVPVLLKPDMGVAIRGTIDYDYPLSPKMRSKEIAIVLNNAELCMASLEPEQGQNGAMRWPPYDIASFIGDFRAGMRLWNRIFFSLPCRFYSGAGEGADTWDSVETASRTEAAKILTHGSQAVPVPPVELFLQGAVPLLRQWNPGKPILPQ